MSRRSLKLKILINVLAVLVYIPLERCIMGKEFSYMSIITPVLLFLPLTLLVKFKNKRKQQNS
jgi:hypothetical protein